MRAALKVIAIDKVMKDNVVGMVSKEKLIEKDLQHVMEVTRPTPKIDFLLNHSEEYLIEINEFQEHQKLGLGYYSEQVLESCHHIFNKYTVGKNRFISGNRYLGTSYRYEMYYSRMGYRLSQVD